MELRSVYQFGSFQLDPAQKILQRDGQRVPLDPKTFLILLALVEAEGRVISKNELMAKVWPNTFVEENNLTKNISRLRKALGNGDESSEFIETIPKVGYRFCAEIQRLAQARNNSADEAIAAGDGRKSDSGEAEAADDSLRRPVGKPIGPWKLWSGLAIALVVGITAVWFGLRRPDHAISPVVYEFAPVRLTNHIAIDGYPAYSPDGKKIAFISNRDGLPAVFLMNADGSDVRKLADGLPNCSWPAWSSDGTKLYFYSEDKWYVMNADGGNPTKIPYPFGRLSPDGKKIVFVTGLVPDSKETHEIFVGDAGGGNVIRLTNNHWLDADPFWSPDGKRIAFTCFPDEVIDGKMGNPEICAMDADGGNWVRLTNNPAWDAGPIWSPDGTRIAFFSRRDCKDGAAAIHVMNADGGNVMRLTECQTFVDCVSWSPDDRKLLYVSDRDGNFEIYAINADPSHQTNVTRHPAEDIEPAWSRDGKTIAFISNRDGKESLFVMDPDGANPRKLVSDISSRVSWSPVGRRIGFAVARAGNVDVYVADADGGGVVQLTHTTAHENEPVWSPDGRKILFSYPVEGTAQLYMMNADGSGAARISNSPEHEWQHDWSPDGKQIVFTRSRNRSVQRDIWMMNADGGNPHMIAASPGEDEFLFPRFSPDGQRIAFQRRVASPLQADIWVMNADGGGQMRLTHRGGACPPGRRTGRRSHSLRANVRAIQRFM
jgi:Tol biopolymer transport system component/DNA-binding winged helix-turn-helix (wHTH) protein